MPKRRNGAWLAFLADASRCTSDECLEGGGTVRPQVRGRNASRYVWMLANGDPGPLHVLHTCDNSMCVNIRHLYLGTHARNVQDSFDRNRRSFTGYRRGTGVAHKAKLTDEQVRDIRSRVGQTATALGKEFGVSQSNVSQILLGHTWRHLL